MSVNSSWDGTTGWLAVCLSAWLVLWLSVFIDISTMIYIFFKYRWRDMTTKFCRRPVLSQAHPHIFWGCAVKIVNLTVYFTETPKENNDIYFCLYNVIVYILWSFSFSWFLFFFSLMRMFFCMTSIIFWCIRQLKWLNSSRRRFLWNEDTGIRMASN